MIWLPLLAGIPTLILAIWSLTETVRSGRSRYWLAIAIRCLLAWPIGLWWASSGFLGYPTTDGIDREFSLISSFADDKSQSIFALVRLKDDPLPRLYQVTGDYQKNRQGFGKAQAQADKGVPMVGRPKRDGVRDDGEMVFYALPPQGLPAKN